MILRSLNSHRTSRMMTTDSCDAGSVRMAIVFLVPLDRECENISSRAYPRDTFGNRSLTKKTSEAFDGDLCSTDTRLGYAWRLEISPRLSKLLA
ncbi:hypothetical protein TKK_0009599 [Trichogramma kaykai]